MLSLLFGINLPYCSISDSREPDEETAPPESETGEGRFVFPNGAVYGEYNCWKQCQLVILL